MECKDLRKIYEFLEFDLLEKFEEPCSHCGYFECKKNILNAEKIIKKRYQWNDIDWKHCLKREKKKLKELLEILNLPEFRNWSYEKCDICKKKFFKHDMKFHSEISIKTTVRGGYELKFVRFCRKCNRRYVHMKNALNKGFTKL